MYIIIAYDIQIERIDDVRKYLKRYVNWIQNSLLEGEVTKSELEEIKKNLIAQLTAPVRWTQTIQQMTADGITSYVEVGPGKVLQGLVKKVNKEAEAVSA